MPVEIIPFKRPDWGPIPREGCINVDYKVLFKENNIAYAMLKLTENATIDEHSAEITIDVCCLEGEGFISIGDDVSPIKAGERVHWPAHILHCLWTEDTTMVTLMIEHHNE